MFELPEPQDDGLHKREVGVWSKDKHHYLRRYIDIFTTGMKNSKWDALNYIDLFSGAGLELVKETGGFEWGSPLIAAQAPTPFSRLFFCDKNSSCTEALRKRLADHPQPSLPRVEHGDANVIVSRFVEEISPKSLSLAFLDPTGLHLHFETLKQLATRRVDFLIFFPDHLDVLRNLEIYLEQPNSNLNRVMGSTEWQQIQNQFSESRWAEQFRLAYEKQIRTLGYEYFDFVRIRRSDNRQLYILLFCCRHERGGEFWRKIASKDRGGQRSLFD